MKNFAMLGRWHVHADGYAREINALEGCCISKVWDADEANAKAWAAELGCEAATVEDILNDPSIEGVIICNATNEHGKLLVRACQSGKAVFTEKVLTLTSKEAEEVREAVKANNTRFAISFPHFSETGTQFAVNAARSGKLGALNYARVRKAHNGSLGDWLPPHFYDPIACGGGAMIDLGAHPMYLLCPDAAWKIMLSACSSLKTARSAFPRRVSCLWAIPSPLSWAVPRARCSCATRMYAGAAKRLAISGWMWLNCRKNVPLRWHSGPWLKSLRTSLLISTSKWPFVSHA